MTENEQEAREAEGQAEYRAAYEALWSRAVETLTQAARLRRPRAGWPPAPVDFAEFVASALAAVSANVGSVERVLAGRPGSWEAAKLGDLLYSTVGDDEDGLIRYRTEPLVIHLNVHRLLANHATGPDHLTPYERELEEIDQRYLALGDQADDDAVNAAWVAEVDALRVTWAARTTAYAEAFTAAVHAEAERTQGLRVPVRVEATTEPDAVIDDEPPHPEDVDYNDPYFDPLALRLWEAARRAVLLPGSDSDGDAPAGGRGV